MDKCGKNVKHLLLIGYKNFKKKRDNWTWMQWETVYEDVIAQRRNCVKTINAASQSLAISSHSRAPGKPKRKVFKFRTLPETERNTYGPALWHLSLKTQLSALPRHWFPLTSPNTSLSLPFHEIRVWSVHSGEQTEKCLTTSWLTQMVLHKGCHMCSSLTLKTQASP